MKASQGGMAPLMIKTFLPIKEGRKRGQQKKGNCQIPASIGLENREKEVSLEEGEGINSVVRKGNCRRQYEVNLISTKEREIIHSLGERQGG